MFHHTLPVPPPRPGRLGLYLPDPADVPSGARTILPASSAMQTLSGNGAGLSNVREKRTSAQPEAKISIWCHISRETPPPAGTGGKDGTFGAQRTPPAA